MVSAGGQFNGTTKLTEKKGAYRPDPDRGGVKFPIAVPKLGWIATTYTGAENRMAK